ncbi:PIG-L family deacetylase [Foetidibacter luteolus]|uniref:PIG-L family deacetylase n=1 Tax=Foetidibacter luteolus TaxID=2608880 RepID=UPI00129AD38C|nr:PIG-L family deacetylase [Foetidibacter luteolus]
MNKQVTIFLTAILFLCAQVLHGQDKSTSPRVLAIVAHPDDESIFCVTLYKIARELQGTVDLFVITNGEAGYKYSTLAEQVYGVKLTDEKSGRSRLPGIRKKELMNAGKILGVSNYYFAEQVDSRFCLDEKEPLDTSWNTSSIKEKLAKVLTDNKYDYAICVLPEPSQHGQHKAASLLALSTISSLPADKKPLVLGALVRNKADSTFKFSGYGNYSETATLTDTALFRTDRTASFSYGNRVNYKVIANWEIAEHKSQGATQMTMNDGDYEEFWYFKQNGNEGLEKCRTFFSQLKQVPYARQTY